MSRVTAGKMMLVRALVLACFPAVLCAQAVAAIVAGGVANPAGGLGKYRSAGPVVRAGVVFGSPRRVSQWRLELESAWMAGQNRLPWFDSRDKDLTSVGVFGTLTVGPRSPLWAPYFAIGAGLQRLTASGVQNPYGTTAGFRTGFGLNRRLGHRHAHLELLVHTNLTDHGAGDFQAGYFFPMVAGLRF